MTDQVIYSMVRVGKMYPPNRQVLRDISLGFFYGAKIGVLGLNGSGKSTLLKIMAGVEEEYLGETMLTKGYTRGLLEQEPQLDNAMTVKELCSSLTKINPPFAPRYFCNSTPGEDE